MGWWQLLSYCFGDTVGARTLCFFSKHTVRLNLDWVIAAEALKKRYILLELGFPPADYLVVCGTKGRSIINEWYQASFWFVGWLLLPWLCIFSSSFEGDRDTCWTKVLQKTIIFTENDMVFGHHLLSPSIYWFFTGFWGVFGGDSSDQCFSSWLVARYGGSRWLKREIRIDDLDKRAY